MPKEVSLDAKAVSSSSDAKEISHEALADRGWVAFQQGSVDEAVKLLEQAVNLCSDNSSYHRRLGLVYWETGGEQGKERAVAQLVEAARLNPREADVFRYLGHYYQQNARDTRRAARCYQKAITLNSEDEEAGEALCNLLEQGGQLVLEAAICREACQHSPRAFWAWRRLGFMEVIDLCTLL
jgi:superkiller protein 3